jgi:hypothetical protein
MESSVATTFTAGAEFSNLVADIDHLQVSGHKETAMAVRP